MFRGLNEEMTFYVTRPYGRSGETTRFQVSAWMPVFTTIFGWLAAVLWSMIACVAAVVMIVHALASLI